MSMFKDIPVDVGVIYEGERIRKPNMQVELGGPDIKNKFELVRVKASDDVEDGAVRIHGPDLKNLKEGSCSPLGILVEVSGKELEQDLEAVFERRIHQYTNYVEGLMHLNQRYDIWLRLSKKSFQKGFNSFNYLGKVLMRLYKSELPIIEKIQTTFITDETEVNKITADAREIYDSRDKTARGLRDEEVDAFYGCALCQSFAPTHVCVITPQRYANCGAISWFDGRAAARVDPKGPMFRIDRGSQIDAEKGEWSGVNAAVKEKSLGAISRIMLYTAFDHPHTSCGCFEAVAFYIPEVDGFGIVHRDFKGSAVNGLGFSTMADSTSGGRQIDGFHGVSIEYMRSPKFLQADGGWNRITWMPAAIKSRVLDYIPKELQTRIATEDSAKTIDGLKLFLTEKEHPITKRWNRVEQEAETKDTIGIEPSITAVDFTSLAGLGLKIVLKDAKITAKKATIRIVKE